MTATQLLPPIVSSPFSKSFESIPYSVHSPAASLHSAPTIHSTTSFTTVIQRPRQPSPASVFSIASAPLSANDENAAPARFPPTYSPTSPRVASCGKSIFASAPRKFNERGRLFSAPLASSAAKTIGEQEITPTPENGDRDGDAVLRNALEELKKYQTAKANAADCEHTVFHQQPTTAFDEGNPAENTTEQSVAEPESEEALPDLPTVHTPPLRNITRDDISSEITPILEQSPLGHSKRLSTNSSGFVHSVKTASFSYGSFSMLSKSLRYGLSSDSHAPCGSHSRFSTDSERPPTTSSIDEAALRRGVNRRQILDEIITSEETYISDLKALVYLMSTLLASMSSVPSRVRASVQQNVLNLLHLHEMVLEKCHRAAFKSAARKWADTISHPQLRSPRGLKFRSLEPQTAARLARIHRRTRSSMDSYDFVRARARLNSAEAADVLEIVSVFNSLMSTFFAYEEYCANHEIIAHDLQRHLPTLWSTYEAGMESLARSVISLDRREANNKKGLTVGDLLIKPIQRICKYPLLFEDLLRATPVADCPSTHSELLLVLERFRDLVDTVNTATHSPEARFHIHRRWSLQSRLIFRSSNLQHEDLRFLGNVILCGVLHVTYQTRLRVDGAYALCVLFGSHFLVAFPAGATAKFEVVSLIKLCDLKVDSATDGKGLQCPSALHTWKLCFSVEGNLYEFMLSACSATEEEQWNKGLRGEFTRDQNAQMPTSPISTFLDLEMKSTGVVYGHHGTLARRLSIQRAATVGNRTSICQVIVRNTHNPEELHEFRQPSTSSINRSQSHLTTNRIVVLAPKRSERARLETMLNDVWTKDKLPYPGIIASRGGQIIRASAGSLVRKLSLASIHAPFSRRSTSLTVSSRKSYEVFSESRRSRERIPTFSIRRDSYGDKPTPKSKQPDDFRELDTMESVISRMIGDHSDKLPSPAGGDGIQRTGTLRKQPVKVTSLPVGPDDSAEAFYPEEVEKAQKDLTVEDTLVGKKKRWSNPIEILKGQLKEGLRGLVYSSR